MWQEIALVSSGFTLAAFVAAAGVKAYGLKASERANLIKNASEADRAELIRNALEFFDVKTDGLDKKQRYQIVLEQIRAREKRFNKAAVIVCVVAVLAAMLAAFAIWQLNKPSDQQPVAPSAAPAKDVPEAAGYLEKSTLRLGMSWDAFAREMKEVDYDTESSPGRLAASYSGRFWNLPARIKHSFRDRKLETSLIEIVAEDCDAVLYDGERRAIGTLSRQCGIGTASNAAEICAAIEEHRKDLISQSGGVFDVLANQYIGEQWLGHQIVLQNGGNGWAEAPTNPGDRQVKATMERFKLGDSVYAQFQSVTWKLNYSAFDPVRLAGAEVDYSSGPPYASSNHYTRSGCVLRYRLSTKQNTLWDFTERKY